MNGFTLFTAFHANLDFSAIPESERAEVIARCYWPLLELPEQHGVPIGVEVPVRTLEILDAEDPEWLKRFLGLVECGAVELLGSGRAQIVAPLAPAEINRLNLALGAAGYRERIGRVPETWFVNEQTWSDGLTSLYREVGARQIVMEWNNPAAARPELRALRGRVARLRARDGGGPRLLWNDSIVFQKVQRAVHGETPLEDVVRYVERLASRPGAHALCVYGGDLEIFDYRPSRPRRGEAAEMARLIDLLSGLAQSGAFGFALPSEVARRESAPEEVTLGSAVDPVPCKKQPRYNPTRWAVSGRDGFGMNTRCHALLRDERVVRRLAAETGQPDAGAAEATLVDLWRSDFRTRATEEKIVEFESTLAQARTAARVRLIERAPGLAPDEDLLLAQPGRTVWSGDPVAIPLRFAPGRFEAITLATRRGTPLAASDHQVDVLGRHRDGSLREVRLLVRPQVAPGRPLGLAIRPADASARRAFGADGEVTDVRALRTPNVDARFLSHRGAALESLAFPTIEERGWLGTIPHGHFESIAFTPDFYSGHVVSLSERSEKRADLAPVALRVVADESGPVCTTLESRFESAYGPWVKRYRVYHDLPRLDLEHRLSFHEARLASLRLGTFTLRPDGWDRDRLAYATVNGGAGVEWRRLGPGAQLRQSTAVSASVSASSCLGSTEGWVAFSDGRRGLVISRDPARAAVAPLLDFEDVDDGFFCRLSHTAAETDETRASFLRGRLDFAFAVEAFDAARPDTLERIRERRHGLVYRTENDVGISTGL